MKSTAQRRALRRQVGPTPWAVLEDMAEDAVRDEADRLVAWTNVRQLARNLGLSKDTVARALRHLVDAGLVARRAACRTEGGTFGTGVYVLAGDRLAGLLSTDLDVEVRHRATESNRRRRQPAPPAQDALFDTGPNR